MKFTTYFSAPDEGVVLMKNMCQDLDSPVKEVCLLCWGEDDLTRRLECYKDPCSVVPEENMEICNALAQQYLENL